MRAILRVTVAMALVGATALADDASAKPRKPQARAARSEKAARPDPNVSYFMGSDPHVPLAIVRDGSFEPTSTSQHPCGAPAIWAKRGSRWRALDPWGGFAGTLKVTASDLYDVTRCHEVDFAKISGHAGTGVAVAEGSGYVPPKSAAYVPSRPERADLDRVARKTAQLYLSKAELTASEKAPVRATFFSVPEAQSDGSRKLVPWAVIDGFLLATAHLVDGAWKVVTVRAPHEDFGHVMPNRYRVRAVFDMNRDGSPEIVLHFDGLDGFEDIVLAYDRTCGWVQVSDSRGGSTA